MVNHTCRYANVTVLLLHWEDTTETAAAYISEVRPLKFLRGLKALVASQID